MNYKKALWAGVELVRNKGFISTNGIIQIQELLEDNQGGIRKVHGTALKNEVTGEVIYTPPIGEVLIRELLSNLENYCNIEDDIDPLIKLAVSHCLRLFTHFMMGMEEREEY